MLFISDANIFIDLQKLDLLHLFDKLGIEIATSDFVFEELNDTQKSIVKELDIKIYEMDSDELGEFFSKFTSANLKKISYQDYSIFYYAKKHKAQLLSNDKRLREFAKRNGVEIKGLFFILDEMVYQKCISCEVMVKKLIVLETINKRVPKSEIDKRVKMWSKS